MQHRVAGGELGREPVEVVLATSARTTPRSSTGRTSSTPSASHRQPDSTRQSSIATRIDTTRSTPGYASLSWCGAEAGAARLLVVELVLERDVTGSPSASAAQSAQRAVDERRDPGVAHRDVLGAADARAERRCARRSGPTRANRSATPRSRRPSCAARRPRPRRADSGGRRRSRSRRNPRRLRANPGGGCARRTAPGLRSTSR